MALRLRLHSQPLRTNAYAATASDQSLDEEGRNVDEAKEQALVELQPRGGYREGQNRAPSSSLHQKPSSVPCSTAFCTTVSESGRADNETKIGRACVDHHHYTTSARNKQRGLLGALQVTHSQPHGNLDTCWTNSLSGHGAQGGSMPFMPQSQLVDHGQKENGN
ncbi:hypothetical protein CI102_7415 [Trichoderma harzianum]|nr:hypothetical protein CI102_7415 [Trichoderma harzianum]